MPILGIFDLHGSKMIKSQFIKDILDLLLDGDEVGAALRSQIEFLEEAKFEYTGMGLFVYFNKLDGIDIFKHSSEGVSGVNGVYIWSTALEIYAEAWVCVEDGFVDYLEIWCVAGDYPNEELTDYMMRQEWIGSPKREIWYRDGKTYSSIL